jgi:phenol/toluene 2-monooxygenase (NADH) P1/A1
MSNNVDLHAREIKPIRQTYAHVAEYIGADKPATRYQEATLGAQPTANFHYRPTWDPEHELYDAARSRVKLKNWYVLTDPRQFYYGTWTMTRARQQDSVEASYQFVESRGLVGKLPTEQVSQICTQMMPLRHVAWGGNMNNTFICAYGYGTSFTAPAMFHAMDHLGVAQYLTRLGLTLGDAATLEAGRNTWLENSRWQPLRRYVEDSFVVRDPFELFVAQNLALDGLMYPLVYNSYVNDRLATKGATIIAMLTTFMSDWHEESAKWVDATVKIAAAESAENRRLISDWARDYADRAQMSLASIAELMLDEGGQDALRKVRSGFDARCSKIGLDIAAKGN